jgi:ferredoxin
VRVTVDTEKCQGYASCLLEAPKVFDLDEDENVAILLMTNPPEDMRPEVERAARLCPTMAIELTDDE